MQARGGRGGAAEKTDMEEIGSGYFRAATYSDVLESNVDDAISVRFDFSPHTVVAVARFPAHSRHSFPVQLP